MKEFDLRDWPEQTPRKVAALLAHNVSRRTRTPLLLRRHTDPAHGTTTAYNWGCGCEPCRAANKAAQRAKRA